MLNGGESDAHDYRCGNDDLRNDNGCGRVEELQKAEGPVSPEENSNKETNYHRRQSHAHIDQADDYPAPGELRQGNYGSHGYPD